MQCMNYYWIWPHMQQICWARAFRKIWSGRRQKGSGIKKGMGRTHPPPPLWITVQRSYPISPWGGADDLMLVMSQSIKSRYDAVVWSSMSLIHSCCAALIYVKWTHGAFNMSIWVCVFVWSGYMRPVKRDKWLKSLQSHDASPVNCFYSRSAV